MLLLFVNEDGPKHLQQMGKLLLSMNQTVGCSQKLSKEKIKILQRNGVYPRQNQIYVAEQDIDRVLPVSNVLIVIVGACNDKICSSFRIFNI